MKTPRYILSAPLILALAAVTRLSAADAPAPDYFGITKPAYVTAASVTTKVTIDSNIFGTQYNVTANTLAPASYTNVGQFRQPRQYLRRNAAAA